MKNNVSWIIKVILISISVSVVITLLSAGALSGSGYISACIVLLVFIFFGIVFDVIGVAVTTAEEAPFHSMAARREKGAVEAIRLIKNAHKVSSICNDVVGDIAGIVSGTTAALVAAKLISDFTLNTAVTQLIVSGLVTGLTIGGKAAGKGLAMSRNTQIVHFAGRVLNLKTRLSGKNNSK